MEEHPAPLAITSTVVCCVIVVLSIVFAIEGQLPKPAPPITSQKESRQPVPKKPDPLPSKPKSPFPFEQSCQSMEAVYNKQFEDWYNQGTTTNKITFSLFGDSRFRVINGTAVCSKGLVHVSADTYDKACTNSNMYYVPGERYMGWGYNPGAIGEGEIIDGRQPRYLTLKDGTKMLSGIDFQDLSEQSCTRT